MEIQNMFEETARYHDRKDAGARLAGRLKGHSGPATVVVGLPRGGVVVAAEVARRLSCPLDIIFAGKLRAPGNPELAIGAVTEDGLVYLNRSVVKSLNVPDSYVETEKKERLASLMERLKLYRKVRSKVPLAGKTVIIVDDGLATGSTMISAVQAARAEGATKIIVAVPGGPPDTAARIRAMPEVNELVCPASPALFFAVSQLYVEFTQVEDGEVIAILGEFAHGERG